MGREGAKLMPTFINTDEYAPGSVVPADVVAEYRAFYKLNFSVAHEMRVTESGGERVVVQQFTPPQTKSSALVCHGYYDHVGIYGHLIEYLLRQDIQVITFDQLGHGLSSGERAHIDSFERYVTAVDDVLKFARQTLGLTEEPLHWVGQSMGGAIVMEYLQQNPQPTREVVLFAPLVRPFAWWLNRWLFAIAKRTMTARSRVFTRNTGDDDFLHFLKNDPLQPRTLPVAWVNAMVEWFTRFERYPVSQVRPKFIQGQADQTVDWRNNPKLLRQRYPRGEWLLLPEARHHLVNETVELREHMWQWLDEQCNWQGPIESAKTEQNQN